MHAIIIFKGVKLFSKQLLSLGIDFVSKLKLLYVAYIVNGSCFGTCRQEGHCVR